MANNDFIQVQEIIDKINISFREQINIAEELTSVINGLNSAYKIAPSTYIKAQKDLNVITEQQISSEEKQLRITQELEKANQAQINTLSKELRLRRQREITLDRNAKAAEKELQKLNAANSIYNKVQQKLNALNKEYRDLAVQKELTGKLTDKEAKRYDFLSGKITKYDTLLKGVDASMGKYSRNVGNYASGFNPLSNSINQLTREAPAFAVSMNTGFLAISNNLPILFDAISQTRNEISKLRAEGQQVPGLFAQLRNSALSWGTALSLGVTLLTLFGGEIIDAIANTKEKTKADEAAKKALEDKNEAEQRYLDTISQSASEEIARSRILFENAKNVNLSMAERKKSIDELRDRYPKYLRNLTDQQILAGQTADAENRLNDALLRRAYAIAIQEKIKEGYKELVGQIVEQRKAEEKLLTVDKDVSKSFDTRIKNIKDNATATEQLRKQQEAQSKFSKAVVQASIDDSKNAQKEQMNEINMLVELYNKYAGYIDTVSEGSDATGKATKEQEGLAQAETNSAEAFQRSISAIERKISLTSKENALYGFLQTQLKILKDAYNALYGEQEQANEETEKTIKYGTADYYSDIINKLRQEQSAIADSSDSYVLYNNIIKSVQDQLDALTGKTKEAAESTKELDDFLKSVSSGALSEIGFSSLNFFTELDQNGQSTFMRLMEQADTFGERAAVIFQGVSSVAEQAFAFINQMSNQSFQIEYDNLEKRYEIAQRFAGDNEAAQEEIRRQYEERRKEIRRRELEAQKEQAVFNAVINTAQGVTAALAQANIPLSVIIAALGAAQIAFIASQQIPAYAEGTMNHPGGMMLVNDAKGANFKEVIQHPDGRIITPNKRNTLMNAPKGTKVYKSRSEFERQREGFDGALNSILSDAGIGGLGSTINRDRFSGVVVNSGNNGLTKEDVYHAFKEAIAGMPVIRQHWDKDGMVEWHETQTTRTLNKGNQVSFKGIST